MNPNSKQDLVFNFGSVNTGLGVRTAAIYTVYVINNASITTSPSPTNGYYWKKDVILIDNE